MTIPCDSHGLTVPGCLAVSQNPQASAPRRGSHRGDCGTADRRSEKKVGFRLTNHHKYGYNYGIMMVIIMMNHGYLSV